KRTIDNIQSPILRLAKNKLGIARTVGTSVMLHRNLGNCNSLWNQLLMKQITGLHIRLNASGPEETLTRIRISQGLAIIGVTENNWDKNLPNICSSFGETI